MESGQYGEAGQPHAQFVNSYQFPITEECLRASPTTVSASVKDDHNYIDNMDIDPEKSEKFQGPSKHSLQNGKTSKEKRNAVTNLSGPITDLDLDLSRLLYGQHIAHEIVVSALKSHLKGNNRKPLVMSFHGWPGGGKNYVTKFIMKHLYKSGEKNIHVHIFSGKAHFPRNSEVDLYQHQLKTWVRGNVSKCPTSLFIFDEVDKMAPGVFDGIKPYLDHHGWIDQTDFRSAIFIFLSNTGSNIITSTVIELYKNGKKREDLRLKDFEYLVAIGAFNEKGGLRLSDAITGNVIDHYVPFLPLEEEHVRRCVVDEFHNKGAHYPKISEIEEVLEYITYGPEEMKIFSSSGCKRVSQKVATVLEKKRFYSEL